MPSKTWNYKTIIGVTVDSRGTVSGTQEVEKQLTRTEKRAVKMIATIQKAFDTLNKSGFNSAKAEVVSAKIIAADEKALRAIRATEAQKVKLTEQTRREQIKTADLSARAAERSAQAQIKAERNAARETERSYQARTKFAVDYAAKEERYSQARFRSAQMLYREHERQQQAESRRTNQLQKAQERASSKRIENVGTIGGGLQSAGVTATAIATAPIVAGFYSAIKVGAEYEQSMNMLQAVTSATAEEMQRAGELSIQLGNDIKLPGVSAKDAAEAMTELGKAGMTVSEAMDAAQGTLQLSTAANISAAQAAEITANALNMFNLKATEAGRVADLLAGAANASSAEITDIAASLQQAGSVFANANVPIEDTVALIAELANAGIKGSDAGTSLKTMMQRLQSPTDNAAAAMKALNVEVYDQAGKMRPMRDIIGQFEKSLGGLSQKQRDQAMNTIFGADAVRAATIVFSEGAKGFDQMSEAVQRNNAAAELAGARTKGLAGAWEALGSQAETIGLIIYNRIKVPLTEVLIYIATFASKTTEAFINLPASVQTGIIAFTGLLAAVGPVVTIIGTLLVAVSSVASAVVVLGGIATVSGVIAAVGVVLAGLTAGIGLAAAAVYGLVEAWENGFGPLASIVAVGAAAILSAISPVLGIPVLIGAMLVTLYEVWTTNFGGIRDFLITVWNKIIEIVQGAMAKLYELTNIVGTRITQWWQENYSLILETVKTVSDATRTVIADFLNWISTFWNDHGQKILAVAGYIWNAVKTVVVFALNTLLDAVTMTMQMVNGNWSGAWDTFLKIVERAAKFLFGLLAGMHLLIKDAVAAIGIWLYENADKIIAGIVSITTLGTRTLIDVIAALPGLLIKLVPLFFSASLSIGQAIVRGIKEGLKNFLSGTDDVSILPKVSSLADLKQAEDNKSPKSIADLRMLEEAQSHKKVKSLADLRQADNLAISGGSNNQTPSFLSKLKNGLEDASKSMDKLGNSTEKTTGKTTKFNKELGALNGNSKKSSNISERLPVSGEGFTTYRRGVNQQFGTEDAIANLQTIARNWAQVSKVALQIGDLSANGGAGTKGHTGHKNGTEADLRPFRTDGKMLPTSWKDPAYDRDLTRKAFQVILASKPNVKILFNDPQLIKEGLSQYYKGHDNHAHLKNIGGQVSGGDNFAENFAEKQRRALEEQSDRKTREFSDAKTQQAIDWANAMREMPDPETIRAYNELLKTVARRKGERQETIEETTDRFKSYSTPQAMTGVIEDQPSPLSRREQRFSDLHDELKIEERTKELNERRLYLADEILQKSVSYGLSLQEAEVDLKVERALLEQRNLLFEAANEFTRQQNDQIRELGDIERDLNVLRQQNSDSQFVEQRRLLSAKREQIGLEKSISELQDNIANVGANSALRYKEAWLSAVYEVKDANIRAVESQIESQVRLADSMEVHSEQVRANVLRHLADQKTMSEAISEGITDVYDKAANKIDSVLDKIGIGKIPIIGDIIKAKSRNLLSGITQSLMDKFLPPGISEQLQKTGNPVADKISESNKYLKQIAANTGGAGGGLFGNGGGGGGGKKSLGFGDILEWFGFKSGGFGSGGGIGGSPNFSSNNFTGGGIHEVLHSAQGGSAGKNSFFGNIKNLFSTGQGGMFAPQANMLNGGKTSKLGGIMGGVGSLMSMVGGFIPGRAGSAISMAGTGMSIGAMFGPWGALAGGIIGGIVGLFSGGKQRKADERARNQAMIDAFSAMDKLVADVNSDKLDGASALAQADDIRAQYLSAMSQLKDKKARNHALADVSRIDSKIATLKAAVSAQTLRKEKMAQLVPTFASGGSVQHKPNGFVTGPGTARSDSILARISNGEYILDHETVKNIGVHHLDKIRAGRGRNLSSVARMMKYVKEPRFADGGFVGESIGAAGMPSSSGGLNLEVKNSVVINGDGTATVKTEVFEIDSPQGRRKLMKTIEEEIYVEGGQRGASKAQIDVQNGKR